MAAPRVPRAHRGVPGRCILFPLLHQDTETDTLLGRSESCRRDRMRYCCLFSLYERLTQCIFTGAGNSLFPVLSANSNPNLRLFGFDYAPQAVKLVQVLPRQIQLLQASQFDPGKPSLPVSSDRLNPSRRLGSIIGGQSSSRY